jgi:hypothetical protein
MYPEIKCRFALAIISKKNELFGLEKINIGPFKRGKLELSVYILSTYHGLIIIKGPRVIKGVVMLQD